MQLRIGLDEVAETLQSQFPRKEMMFKVDLGHCNKKDGAAHRSTADMKISEDAARIASALILDWSRQLTKYPGSEIVHANTARHIKSLVVFGDELSDTGNLFKATNFTTPDPNYFFQGRFSNGPVWSDFIQNVTVLDSVANFAVGGATAMTTNRQDRGNNF
ncbi:hypothetical protein DSO57_1031228 [Entomophthora muscae]|uniref:Uncharacterized protein n=1 Tax=Entomophthora muscae TaxID=34485 RepID=A0ACC2TN23_9FUNG|nr:hypothetical protein DSO57_1031228 [Entomophthora muscae]